MGLRLLYLHISRELRLCEYREEQRLCEKNLKKDREQALLYSRFLHASLDGYSPNIEASGF